MTVVIDTNGCRAFCAGLPEVVQLFRTAERILVPFVVLAQLRAGSAAGSRGRDNERILGLSLNRRRVSLVFADEEATFHCARLYGQLRRQGTPIPAHDL